MVRNEEEDGVLERVTLTVPHRVARGLGVKDEVGLIVLLVVLEGVFEAVPEWTCDRVGYSVKLGLVFGIPRV